MYDDLCCKVYIDFEKDYNILFGIVKEFTNACFKIVGTMVTSWGELYLCNNDYDKEKYLENRDDFVYWQYYLDIVPSDISEEEYIQEIQQLLGKFRSACIRAVAACDFEDKLII